MEKYKNKASNQGYAKKSYQEEQKKHSGCKQVIISKGQYEGSTAFSGWNYSKARGLLSFFAAPYNGTHETKGKVNGNLHLNYILKITNKRTMQIHIMPCLYNKSTGKVTCMKLNLVMNPKAPNGGYCGKVL